MYECMPTAIKCTKVLHIEDDRYSDQISEWHAASVDPVTRAFKVPTVPHLHHAYQLQTRRLFVATINGPVSAIFFLSLSCSQSPLTQSDHAGTSRTKNCIHQHALTPLRVHYVSYTAIQINADVSAATISATLSKTLGTRNHALSRNSKPFVAAAFPKHSY